MADELDDIFGAIDGDEEVLESESKDKIDDEGAVEEESNDEEGKGETESSGDGDNDDTTEPKTTTTSDTTKLYNSIMYAQTTSHLRDQQQGASELMASAPNKKKADDADKHVATDKVNTGTSHDKTVRSYSAYPKNLPEGMELPTPKKMDKPAKEYPFTLDPFQAQAVGYIEKEESVLVAAHTSAGKTAVAEYAIAKALNEGQRVVYTSPIKVSLLVTRNGIR